MRNGGLRSARRAADDHPFDSTLLRVVVAGIGVTVGLVLIACLWRSSGLWGADSFSYLPRPLVALVLAGAAGAAVAVFRGSDRPARQATPGTLWISAGLILAGLWALRSATLVYGDGLPIVSSVIRGDAIPIHEPLSAYALRWAEWFHRLAMPALDPFARAWNSAAIISCFAGILFAAGSWWLAHELCRNSDAALATAAFFLLVSQGSSLLFFGYVEYYSLPMSVVPTFTALCVRHLRTGSLVALASAAGLSALGLILHVGMAVLVPALLLLIWLGPSTTSKRVLAMRTILALALLLLAVSAASLIAARNPWDTLGALTRAIAEAPSSVHGRPTFVEWFNVQVLVGPLSIPLALAVHAATGWPRTRIQWFAVALAAGPMAAAILASRSNLGYARNWDLLAMFAPAIAASAVVRIIEAVPSRMTRRALLVLGVVSATLTVSWGLVFSSETASLARFATLPLGPGQAASTLGFWHALRGRYAEALPWLDEAIQADRSNVRAWMSKGRVLAMQRRHEEALVSFLEAARLRPDLESPLAGAALAALEAGRTDTLRRLLDGIDASDPSLVGPSRVRRMLATDSLSSSDLHESLRRLRDF